MTEPFPLSGSIEPASFPHLLVDLHRRGATGSLKVTGPSHPKALYFRNGRILFGSSNDPRDQLGSILIESGRISREQLDEVNAKVGPGNPLAKVLSDSGFVNQRELGDAARTKVERILADVLSWESGAFEFEDGVLPKGAVDLKLSTEKLLLAAVLRIPDRSFALRHVGLGSVLEPAPGGEAALGEVRAEVWPLLERLDGQRTLKDAIALTQLDEFEAAKTACALLFLGIAREHAAEREVDLAQEAQSAFAEPEEEPLPSYGIPPSHTLPPTSSEPTGFAMAEPELPVFAFEPEAPSESAPAEPPAAEPVPEDADAEPPIFPAFVEAEPAPETDQAEEPIVVAEAPAELAQEEPTFIMPPTSSETGRGFSAAGESDAPAGGDVEPPRWPAARPGPILDLPEPQTPAPAAGSRPTQQDLAALDALLSPSASARLVRPVERPQSEKWEPQFQSAAQPPRRPATRVAPRAGSAASRVPIIVTAIAGVLLATAAAWYYFLRSPGRLAVRTSPPVTAAPVAGQTVRPPASSTPAAVPSSPPHDASRPTTAAAMPTPAPTAVPVRHSTPPPVARPATPPPATASTAHDAPPGDARALLGRGALAEAARSFGRSLAPGSRGRFSIQLLTACSPETVQKAVAAGGQELFILPVSLQGRSCYRVCWGVYDSRAAAEAGLAGVPPYFRQSGVRPRLSVLAELLP